MLDWFVKTIGLGDQFAGHLDEASFDFQHWKTFWVGLGLLVPVAYFVFWWQWRSLTNTPPLLRVALSLTRVLVLALLVVVLASPIIMRRLCDLPPNECSSSPAAAAGEQFDLAALLASKCLAQLPRQTARRVPCPRLCVGMEAPPC